MNTSDQNQIRVVAIGASAGGLEAFETFFETMPDNIGLAFVVITHLMPNHTSVLAELIAKFTAMQVFTIGNIVSLKKNCVYVLPPDKNVEIKDSSLVTVEQQQPHHQNMPIDHFFTSLAEARGDKSLALVFSGSGFDGTLGMRAIKKAGGIIMVQQPETAKFDSMPQSAIDTQLTDFILPIEGLVKEIVAQAQLKDNLFIPSEMEIRTVYNLLETHTGHDFSNYKINTINRRIERQMQRNHIGSINDYIALLSKEPDYIDKLFEDLLIGVTSFFRDNFAFEALKTILAQKFSIKKTNGDTIRVWVPGCASGQEAYTIAILLLEIVRSLKLKAHIQIFATDIDSKALDFARAAIYHKSEISNISRERLENFFILENNHYKLKKDVREIVTFGFQNIILDPPFTKIDLISCRNLLIYFNTELQKKLFRIFHYSLKSKSLLFLGSSEAVTGIIGLFRLTSKDWKIYERNDGAMNSSIMLNYPSVKRYPEYKIPLSFKVPLADKADLGNFVAKHFLGTFISAVALINAKGKILYTQGNINTFIKDLSNEAQNFFDLFPERLKSKLLNGIDKALDSQTEVGLFNLDLKNLKDKTSYNIFLLPIPGIESTVPLIGVFFQNVITEEQIDFILEKHGTEMEISKKIIAVQQELEFTKETLQTTVEELQSNNEELQSTNEELQSTIEEIETSKEELLSLNEELIILNSELQTRIDLSTSVTQDLNNLFNSTQIIAVFLDKNLCIKLFTPRVDTIMHLRERDVGRPWAHFSNTLNYNDFDKNFHEVMRSDYEMSFEVPTHDGLWFKVRIIPYHTLINTIDGVVVTFSDITSHRSCMSDLVDNCETLSQSLKNVQNVFNSLRHPILILDHNFHIINANQYFYQFIDNKPEFVIGKSVVEIFHHDTDYKAIQQDLDKISTNNNFTLETNIKIKLTDDHYKFSHMLAHQLVDISKEPMILLIFREAHVESN